MNQVVRQITIALIAVAIFGFAGLPNTFAQLRFDTPRPTTQGTPALRAPSSFARPPAQPRKPIPLAAKIAIVLGGLAAAGFALVLAMRVWRSSNLFDRQYRFPEIESVAVRLGGTRSGGTMSVLEFETADVNLRRPPPESLR